MHSFPCLIYKRFHIILSHKVSPRIIPIGIDVPRLSCLLPVHYDGVRAFVPFTGRSLSLISASSSNPEMHRFTYQWPGYFPPIIPNMTYLVGRCIPSEGDGDGWLCKLNAVRTTYTITILALERAGSDDLNHIKQRIATNASTWKMCLMHCEWAKDNGKTCKLWDLVFTVALHQLSAFH